MKIKEKKTNQSQSQSEKTKFTRRYSKWSKKRKVSVAAGRNSERNAHRNVSLLQNIDIKYSYQFVTNHGIRYNVAILHI